MFVHMDPKARKKRRYLRAVLVSLCGKTHACVSNTLRATQNQLRFQFSGEFANVIQ